MFVATDVSDARRAALVATAVEPFGGSHCAVNAAAIENETVASARMPRRRLRSHANGERAWRVLVHEARDRGDARQRARRGRARGDRQHRPHELVPAAARPTGLHGVEARRARPHPQSRRTTTPDAGSGSTPSAPARSTRRCCARRWSDAAVTPTTSSARLSLLGRFGRPDEIAAAALWLCSDAASFTMGHAARRRRRDARQLSARSADPRRRVRLRRRADHADHDAARGGRRVARGVDGRDARRADGPAGDLDAGPSVAPRRAWRAGDRRRCRPRSCRSPRRPG